MLCVDPPLHPLPLSVAPMHLGTSPTIDVDPLDLLRCSKLSDTPLPTPTRTPRHRLQTLPLWRYDQQTPLRAALIVAVHTIDRHGAADLTVAGLGRLITRRQFVARRDEPVPGDYFVVFPQGGVGWIGAELFEPRYARVV